MDLLLIAIAVLLGPILLTMIGRDGIMWTIIVVGSLTVGILMLLVVDLAAITSPADAWAKISDNGLILSIAMAVLLGLVLLTVIGASYVHAAGHDGVMWTIIVVGSLVVCIPILLVVHFFLIMASPELVWDVINVRAPPPTDPSLYVFPSIIVAFAISIIVGRVLRRRHKLLSNIMILSGSFPLALVIVGVLLVIHAVSSSS